MPVSGKSARRKLPFLLTTDSPEIHAAAEALCAALDNDVEIKTGKLSERPAASLFGRLFYVQGDVTAANNGIIWLDLGATWTAVNSPGEWIATALGAKITDSGGQTTRVRLEGGGSVVRLRGNPQVSSLQTLTAGETILTIPSGFRPVAGPPVYVTPVGNLSITVGGVMTCDKTLAEATRLNFDGITYNVT